MTKSMSMLVFFRSGRWIVRAEGRNTNQIGDVLIDRVSKLPFMIVDEVMLNNIPHVKLKCQAPEDSRTKTLSRAALSMNFQRFDMG
jgi:hypothetical protein